VAADSGGLFDHAHPELVFSGLRVEFFKISIFTFEKKVSIK
jgi:hypothetical protein